MNGLVNGIHLWIHAVSISMGCRERAFIDVELYMYMYYVLGVAKSVLCFSFNGVGN